MKRLDLALHLCGEREPPYRFWEAGSFICWLSHSWNQKAYSFFLCQFHKKITLPKSLARTLQPDSHGQRAHWKAEPTQAPDPSKLLEKTLATEQMEHGADQHLALFLISAAQYLSISQFSIVMLIKLYQNCYSKHCRLRNMVLHSNYQSIAIHKKC